MDDVLDNHKDLSIGLASHEEYQIVSDILKKPFEMRTDQETNAIISLISKVPFFIESLGHAKDLHSVLLECTKSFMHETYQRGDIIFHNGDNSEKIYLLLAGKVGALIPKELSLINKQIEENKNKHKSPSNPLKALYLPLHKIGSRKSSPNSNKQTPPQTDLNSHKTILTENEKTEHHMSHIAAICYTTIKAKSAFCKINKNSMPPGNFKRTAMKGHLYMPIMSSSLNFNMTNDSLEFQEKILFINDQYRNRYYRDEVCTFKLIKLLSPGQYFGEKGVILERTRRYSAVAVDDVELVSLNKEQVNSIFQVHIDRTNAKNMHLMHLLHISSQLFISKLAPYFKDVFFSMNDKIYSEGDESDSVYVLGEGEIKIIKSTEKNEIDMKSSSNGFFSSKVISEDITNLQKLKKTPKIHREITLLSPGAFFGHEPLFNIPQRSYTAIVTTAEALVYKLSIKEIKNLQKIKSDILEIMKSKAYMTNKWIVDRVRNINDSAAKLKISFNKLVNKESESQNQNFTMHHRVSNEKPLILGSSLNKDVNTIENNSNCHIEVEEPIQEENTKHENFWITSVSPLTKSKSIFKTNFNDLEFHEKVIITNEKYSQKRPQTSKAYQHKTGLFNEPSAFETIEPKFFGSNSGDFSRPNGSFGLTSPRSTFFSYLKGTKMPKNDMSSYSSKKPPLIRLHSAKVGNHFLDHTIINQSFRQACKITSRPTSKESYNKTFSLENVSNTLTFTFDDLFQAKRCVVIPISPKATLVHGHKPSNCESLLGKSDTCQNQPKIPTQISLSPKNNMVITPKKSKSGLPANLQQKFKQLLTQKNLMSKSVTSANHFATNIKTASDILSSLDKETITQTNEYDLDCDLLITQINLPTDTTSETLEKGMNCQSSQSKVMISSKHNLFRKKPSRIGLISERYKLKRPSESMNTLHRIHNY